MIDECQEASVGAQDGKGKAMAGLRVRAEDFLTAGNFAHHRLIFMVDVCVALHEAIGEYVAPRDVCGNKVSLQAEIGQGKTSDRLITQLQQIILLAGHRPQDFGRLADYAETLFPLPGPATFSITASLIQQRPRSALSDGLGLHETQPWLFRRGGGLRRLRRV